MKMIYYNWILSFKCVKKRNNNILGCRFKNVATCGYLFFSYNKFLANIIVLISSNVF